MDFKEYLNEVSKQKGKFKIGDKVKWKNGETVTIVKIKDAVADRDFKGRKLKKPIKSTWYTVQFDDGEQQTGTDKEFR